MSLWIKLCGMTDAVGVEAARVAAVDAIGFVFAPSIRRIDPAQAASLARAARGHCALVAVMRHPSQADVDAVLALLRPDILQSDAEDFAALALPSQLVQLPVLRASGSAPAGRVLFEGAHSGSGRTADWAAATALARRQPLVLAGGLNPDNIAEAIRAVQPAGVDVSSGVEGSPGRKDPERIARFTERARAAARATGIATPYYS